MTFYRQHHQMTFYRQHRVEAVQWSGSNWHEMYEMTGHSAWVMDGQLKVNVDESTVTVLPTAWVLKLGSHLSVMSDEQFTTEFEEIT